VRSSEISSTTSEPKQKVRHGETWIREFELTGLDGSTVDAAVSAQARFQWMRTDGKMLHAYGEMITSVGLHLISQVIQFTLLTYFIVGFVQPQQYPFSDNVMPNITSEIELAMVVNNFNLVSRTSLAMCTTNTSFSWTHRLMMFILITKMLPDMCMALWYIYKVWSCSGGEGNYDKEEKQDETIDIPAGHYYVEGNEPYQKALTTRMNRYNSVLLEEEGEWRDMDKVKGEWKKRALILSHDAMSSFKYKNLKNPFLGPKKEDYPLSFHLMQQEEVHNIGRWNLSWKIFITVFVLIPNIVMTMYITFIGTRLIAYTGTLSKLVRTALKIKFVLKIPEAIFEGYVSSQLKEYIENAVYFDEEEDLRPYEALPVRSYDKADPDKISPWPLGSDPKRAQNPGPIQKEGFFKGIFVHWEAWLATAGKLFVSMCLSYVFYDVQFAEIVSLRAHCTEYFRFFQGLVLAPPEIYKLW